MGFWESMESTYAALLAARETIPFHVKTAHDFYQSFIEADRWLLYIKGLGLTLQLTLCALAALKAPPHKW